jgi:hypothetical protein
MEHKSWVDREIAMKLLLYLLRVQEWLARNGHPPQLVIPILVYRGEAVWDEPLSLRENVSAKPQHKQFIPDMSDLQACQRDRRNRFSSGPDRRYNRVHILGH